MTPMERSEPPPRTVRLPWIGLLALLVAVGAAALVLLERFHFAGAVLAISALVFVVADVRSGRAADPGVRFGDAVSRRLADAAVLGGVAWVSVDDDPYVAAAALTALGTAYLAAYVRAKAVGLGFRLSDGIPGEAPHFLIVALGFQVGDMLQFALWLAAAVSAVSLVRGGSGVARQQETP
jgi:hypothetical protein